MSELMLSKIGGKGKIEFPVVTAKGYGQSGYDEWLYTIRVQPQVGAGRSGRLQWSGTYHGINNYPDWVRTGKNVYIYFVEQQFGAMSGEWFTWYHRNYSGTEMRSKMTLKSGYIYYEADSKNPNYGLDNGTGSCLVVLMNLDALK